MKLNAWDVGTDAKCESWTTACERDSALVVIVEMENRNGITVSREIAIGRKSLLAAFRAGELEARGE